MKKMRKIFAMLLALAMVLGMTTTAFAAVGEEGDAGNQGTITVSGITSTGVTVKYYQIAKATYGTDEQFKNYVSTVNGVTLPAPDAQGKISFTKGEIETIVSKVAAGQYEAGIATGDMTPGENGTYTATVPVGSYLIVVEDATDMIYNPMIASVYFAANADRTGNVIAVENTQAKATTDPVIDKKVDNVEANTVKAGDELSFSITVNPIPYYGGTTPTFQVIDTLTGGLEYVDGSLEIKVGNETVDSEAYTETGFASTSKTFTIDFVKNGVYGLDKYADASGLQTNALVVSYKAKVTNEALVNGTPNVNNAEVKYSRDGQVISKNDSTNTYTFSLKDAIKKVKTDGSVLGGAEFTLYNNAACGENDVVAVKESDENGQFEFTALKEGNYWLKETKAPEGYTLNTNTYAIQIIANMSEDGKSLESWEIKVDGTKVDGSDVTTPSPVAIQNTTISSLPSTGGIGTTIFTIGGCIIMIVAAGLFFATRRKAVK